MEYKPVNFQEKFSKFTEYWTPKIIAQLNDYHFKLAKIKGEFVWHAHPETDEVFIVIHGGLDILFRDGKVALREGEMFVVPKGVEHKPVASNECHILLVEPVGTVNTGNVVDALTTDNRAWI